MRSSTLSTPCRGRWQQQGHGQGPEAASSSGEAASSAAAAVAVAVNDDGGGALRRNSSIDVGCVVRLKPVDGWRRLPMAQVPQGRYTLTNWQQESVCMEESTGKLFAIGGGQVRVAKARGTTSRGTGNKM